MIRANTMKCQGFFTHATHCAHDIEQTLVLGAHGPYRVHVVLVKDPAFRPGHGDEANS